MNRVYTLVLTAFILVVSLPMTSLAQCGCATPDTLTQLVTIDTSDAPKVLITFQKFYDPTGKTHLGCMSIQDTISVISSTLVRNQSVGPITNADFTVQVSAKISGPPSINSTGSNMLSYGPYDFGPAGSTSLPSDSVILGPDMILDKKVINATPTNVAPYEGPGTVSDTLSFGGGALSDAGTTFDYSIRTKYWGTAKITFSICPTVILATSIQGFSASLNNNGIGLQWITTNEQPNTHYEIQISTDSKNFYTVGEAEGNASSTGTSAKYQYQYNPDPTDLGKLYFRVKETDAYGKVSYSIMLIVDPKTSGSGPDENISYRTYPNPATNSLMLQFNGNRTGRFLVELISTSGQVIQQKLVTLTGAAQIRMDLNPQPVKGLYFLRTTDQSHSRNYISKVFIE